MTPNEKNGRKFKVLEGNRRITVLKLLKNNKLIPEEHKPLLNRFKKLSSDYEKNPIKNVPCVVFPNADEANKWIGLKHTGENDGIGTVTWDAQQKAKFEKKVKGKTIYALPVFFRGVVAYYVSLALTITSSNFHVKLFSVISSGFFAVIRVKPYLSYLRPVSRLT